MSGALEGPFDRRRARRQAFMERLCEALERVLGPSVTLEPHGWRGIVVWVAPDGEGTGGAAMSRAAPLLPRPTWRSDLVATARGVADAVHFAVLDLSAAKTGIGPSRPTVTARGEVLAIRFFGVNGEPLPIVEVPLLPAGG